MNVGDTVLVVSGVYGEDYCEVVNVTETLIAVSEWGFFHADTGEAVYSKNLYIIIPEEIIAEEEVKVRQQGTFLWEGGYIFITQFKNKYVCYNTETKEIKLWDEIKPKEFCPEKGDTILVSLSAKGNFEPRIFEGMLDDKFLCQIGTLDKHYFAWDYARCS